MYRKMLIILEVIISAETNNERIIKGNSVLCVLLHSEIYWVIPSPRASFP